ncbi:MAG: cyclophilin-like fold protein [Pseudomonadota bacterium]
MARKVLIAAGDVTLSATLRDTPTADAIWDALPISGRVMTWGCEIYFSTSLSISRDADAKSVMEPGEIAFWPDGSAIAVGFGPTPISQADEIRLASPSNVWADADGDVRMFETVSAGEDVSVTRLTG